MRDDQDKKDGFAIRRPVVSDADGTREGGLVFCISLMGGMVAAVSLAPGALTSFWVWCGLIAMAFGIALSAQRAVAAWNGFVDAGGEDVQ